MSLLMDALKRAETSKQEAARNLSGKPLSPSELLSLEPLPDEPGRATATPLPKLAAQHDESWLVQQFLALAPRRPRSKRVRHRNLSNRAKRSAMPLP